MTTKALNATILIMITTGTFRLSVLCAKRLSTFLFGSDFALIFPCSVLARKSCRLTQFPKQASNVRDATKQNCNSESYGGSNVAENGYVSNCHDDVGDDDGYACG